ncbi:HNH endonuclease [Mycobacterium colombiense]
MAEKSHTPKPLRYVWHHVLPRVCGGQTVPANLASVCDVCHYGIHVLLHELAKNGGKLVDHWHLGGTGRYEIALRGYQAAVAAGTVSKIPNEGSD